MSPKIIFFPWIENRKSRQRLSNDEVTFGERFSLLTLRWNDETGKKGKFIGMNSMCNEKFFVFRFVLFHFFSQFNIWHLRSQNYERHKCKVINYLSYLTTSKNYYWLSDSNTIQITFISVPFQFRSGYRSSLLFSISVSNFRPMPFNRPEHILNVSNSQPLPFYRTCNARQYSNSH